MEEFLVEAKELRDFRMQRVSFEEPLTVHTSSLLPECLEIFELTQVNICSEFLSGLCNEKHQLSELILGGLDAR